MLCLTTKVVMMSCQMCDSRMLEFQHYGTDNGSIGSTETGSVFS